MQLEDFNFLMRLFRLWLVIFLRIIPTLKLGWNAARAKFLIIMNWTNLVLIALVNWVKLPWLSSKMRSVYYYKILKKSIQPLLKTVHEREWDITFNLLWYLTFKSTKTSRKLHSHRSLNLIMPQGVIYGTFICYKEFFTFLQDLKYFLRWTWIFI